MTKKLGRRAPTYVILTKVRTQSKAGPRSITRDPDFRQDDGGRVRLAIDRTKDRTGAGQSSSATISAAISAGNRDAPSATVETVAHRPSNPAFAIAV
jgi:hypothetical protein